MLEHVRPNHPLLGPLADSLNTPCHTISDGSRLNRRTADNVVAARHTLMSVETRPGGAVSLIVAQA